MLTLLLASWLSTQTWTWTKNPEPDVAAYRVYFSMGMTIWCQQDRVEVPASVACDATECQLPNDMTEPPFSPVFFIVTAVDAAGNESGTGHGAVEVCP